MEERAIESALRPDYENLMTFAEFFEDAVKSLDSFACECSGPVKHCDGFIR